MVEAIKHLSDTIDFATLTVPAKENTGYKSQVAREGSNQFQDLSKLLFPDWEQIITAHLNKMNAIVHDSFSFPQSLISQLKIFQSQLERFIEPLKQVAVLSAFPVFLLDYYGVEGIMNHLTPPSGE